MSPRVYHEAMSYLWKNFPQHCIVLAEEQTRRVVDLGIERAAVHGFLAMEQACAYLGLMVMLGSYFDVDPMLPWAGEALRRSIAESRPAAMDRLYAKTVVYLEKTAGPEGEFYRRALIRARSMAFEVLRRHGRVAARPA